MPFIPLHAVLVVAVPLLQDAVIPPPARVPLPRPVANAPVGAVNQNLVAAGRRVRDTLTLSLDIVEAAFQAEGSTIRWCASWRSPSGERRRRCPARCSARRWERPCGSRCGIGPTPR